MTTPAGLSMHTPIVVSHPHIKSLCHRELDTLFCKVAERASRIVEVNNRMLHAYDEMVLAFATMHEGSYRIIANETQILLLVNRQGNWEQATSAPHQIWGPFDQAQRLSKQILRSLTLRNKKKIRSEGDRLVFVVQRRKNPGDFATYEQCVRLMNQSAQAATGPHILVRIFDFLAARGALSSVMLEGSLPVVHYAANVPPPMHRLMRGVANFLDSARDAQEILHTYGREVHELNRQSSSASATQVATPVMLMRNPKGVGRLYTNQESARNAAECVDSLSAQLRQWEMESRSLRQVANVQGLLNQFTGFFNGAFFGPSSGFGHTHGQADPLLGFGDSKPAEASSGKPAPATSPIQG